MKLTELFAGTGARIQGDPETEVAALAYDNRRAEPGGLFFCVRGARVDGHDLAEDAVAAGAAALVVDRPLEIDVPQVVVADVRGSMPAAARRFFGNPTAELRVAGITGTAGKTTTAYWVRHILEAVGINAGLLGTVKVLVGGRDRGARLTTPEAIDLQHLFREMLDSGDRACVMEVSSHALAIGRVEGVHFTSAAFTNLSQDHLDFHADMEDYFRAKRMLFIDAAGRARLPEASVVNVDDRFGARLAAELKESGGEAVSCSARGAAATYRATGVELGPEGSAFQVHHEGAGAAIEASIPVAGEFNVANALLAIAIAGTLGVDAGSAAAALSETPVVPGRLEPVNAGQPFSVLVDYSHKPGALETVLETARGFTDGRIITVFGAGGDRDSAKRPLMGEIGARLSDLPIVTSDNPRSEDPETIIEQITAGIGDSRRSAVVVEPDRRLAIAAALAAAEPGDTVVIAGKGHEQGQEFENGRKIPFDDRDVAREELEKLGLARRDAE